MSTRLGGRQRRTLAALAENGHYPNAWSWPISHSETLRILESLERRGLVERRARPGQEDGRPVSAIAAHWYLTADGYLEATGGGDYGPRRS